MSHIDDEIYSVMSDIIRNIERDCSDNEWSEQDAYEMEEYEMEEYEMEKKDAMRMQLEKEAEQLGLSLYEYLHLLYELNNYNPPGHELPYDPQWPIDYIDQNGGYSDEGQEEYMY